jgi:hypothetical protein
MNMPVGSGFAAWTAWANELPILRPAPTIEPLPESLGLILFQLHAAVRPCNVTASNIKMDDQLPFAPRLGIGHTVDIDVLVIAYFDNRHSKALICFTS